ncbi:hypothetical protein [Notoacmeibacter sp. MSK16QG-6]|uniref:DUF6949 family protein n=1 Tax=Notoacmeibacter sp. MSK16QG-6 TaxID=2957982 RepID=UPI0020A1F9F7|nr:hypothetical protein [Notoacmeibacter sp. MSK16QG-6]MCP1197862.1 hypothetical protein [Notoacmeibacter sp. MSK16QG-6]
MKMAVLFLIAWCFGMTMTGLTASLVTAHTGCRIIFAEIIDRRRPLLSAFLWTAALGPALALNEGLAFRHSTIFLCAAVLIANLWAIASGIVLIGLIERLL